MRCGNKGAQSISFNLGGTRLLFINCHLVPHQPNVDRRSEEWNRIYDQFVQPYHWDAVVWLGDKNYRVDADSYEECASMMEQDMWKELALKDQLTAEREMERIGQGFEEGEINFAPTFKFKNIDLNTFQNYVKRNPSWTDRILYRSREGLLQQVNYDSNNDIRLSDHRAVFSQFLLAFDENCRRASKSILRAMEEIENTDSDGSDCFEMIPKSGSEVFNNLTPKLKRKLTMGPKNFDKPNIENSCCVVF